MMRHRVNFVLPSLRDTAFIQPERRNPYALLELTAHGGHAVEDGALEDNFEGIDTLKASLAIRFHSGGKRIEVLDASSKM